MEENIYKDILDVIYSEDFKDGDVYSYEDLRLIFKDKGIPNESFDSLLQSCIRNNWLIDCGGGCYTR